MPHPVSVACESEPRAEERRGADHAPRCTDPAQIFSALGLRPSAPWLWLHVGPIDTRTSPLVLHGDAPPPARDRRIIGGGGVHRCHTPTEPGWRGAEGLWLDRLAVCERPPRGLRRTAHPLDLKHGTALWVVYAAASTSPDGSGPWADWDAGTDEIVYHGGAHRRLATDDLRAFVRLGALLDGVPLGPGRPGALAPDPVHLAVALRAEGVKAQYPRRTLRVIARGLGLDERTLRRYRQELAWSRGLADEAAAR